MVEPMLTHFKNTHALVEHSRISHALCVSCFVCIMLCVYHALCVSCFVCIIPLPVYCVCMLFECENSLIDISSANNFLPIFWQYCMCVTIMWYTKNIIQSFIITLHYCIV